MWPLSAAAKAALQVGYEFQTLCSLRRDGQLLQFGMDLTAGEVAFTSGTGVQRTLRASFAPEPGLFDALADGPRLRVTWVMRHIDGTPEYVPMGTFDVDEHSLTYGTGGQLDVTGHDLWARVIASRFPAPRQPHGNVVDVAVAWAREAIGADLQGVRAATSTVKAGGQVYDPATRDRSGSIAALLGAAGLEAFISRDDYLVIRKVPSLAGVSAWTVRDGRGVFTTGRRSRSRQGFFNAVVVNPVGVRRRFRRVEVRDTDPTSPTHVGGPYGYVPVFVSDPRILDEQQALVVARAKLPVGLSRPASLEATAAPNPALDPGDVVAYGLRGQGGDAPVNERHLAESFNVPLVAGTQQIASRSPRPEGNGDQEATAA